MPLNNSYGQYLAFGLQFTITVALSALLGWWIDSKLGLNFPLFLLLFLFGAVALSLKKLLATLNEKK